MPKFARVRSPVNKSFLNRKKGGRRQKRTNTADEIEISIIMGKNSKKGSEKSKSKKK